VGRFDEFWKLKCYGYFGELEEASKSSGGELVSFVDVFDIKCFELQRLWRKLLVTVQLKLCSFYISTQHLKLPLPQHKNQRKVSTKTIPTLSFLPFPSSVFEKQKAKRKNFTHC
jgi:hypothetical protein